MRDYYTLLTEWAIDKYPCRELSSKYIYSECNKDFQLQKKKWIEEMRFKLGHIQTLDETFTYVKFNDVLKILGEVE